MKWFYVLVLGFFFIGQIAHKKNRALLNTERGVDSARFHLACQQKPTCNAMRQRITLEQQPI